MNEDVAANPEHELGYGYRVVTVDEAVERAFSGEWDVPEFQRQFVWQPAQVCDLADSLWRNYPIGALLLWRSAESNDDLRRARWWIADGQQRLTSLCILCGREPVWLRRKPAKLACACCNASPHASIPGSMGHQGSWPRALTREQTIRG